MAIKTWIINGGTNSVEWKCRLVVDLNSQSTTNNTSNLTVTFQYTRARSSSYGSNGATTAYIGINGTNYTIGVPSYNYGYIGVDDWKTLGSKTVDVGHDSVGYKSVAVSGSWSQSGVQPSSASASSSVEMPTIARASSVSCATGNIGSNTTITITKANSSFTHTLTYSFGSLTGTIATNTSSATVSWAIPTSFYAQIPNASSGSGTITCRTYSGGTSLGTKTCSFTVNVANSSPTVSMSVIDSNSATLALTGSNTKFIKYYSKAKATITTTAKNSASIKTTTFTSGAKSTTSTTVSPTLYISNVESTSFSATTKDSRGLSGSVSTTLTLVDYVKLAITSLTVTRPTSTSTTVNLVMNGNYFNSTFGSVANTLTLVWKYRLKGATTWITGATKTPTRTGNTFSLSTSLGTNFDYSSAYEFTFTVTDKLMTSTSARVVEVGTPLMEIGKDEIIINSQVRFMGEILNPDGKCLDTYTHPTTVVNGSNFDAIRTAGRYTQGANANVSDNLNMPSKIAFTMDVYNISSMTMQVFYGYNGTKIYIRTYYDWSGTWTRWNSYSGSYLMSSSSGITNTTTGYLQLDILEKGNYILNFDYNHHTAGSSSYWSTYTAIVSNSSIWDGSRLVDRLSMTKLHEGGNVNNFRLIWEAPWGVDKAFNSSSRCVLLFNKNTDNTNINTIVRKVTCVRINDM